MTQSNVVGKVVRVEWNQQENSVRLVLEITDESFKSRVLHSKEYEEILSICGTDVVVAGD
jgi:predicted Abi (CAAX) family protease